MKQMMGSKNPMWKGDSVGYKAIHDWLFKHFGKANKCENDKCEKRSKRFEWSLKKGFHHSHNRDNYWMLCQPCHRSYDITPEQKEKIRKSMMGHASWNGWDKIPKDSWGRFSKK